MAQVQKSNSILSIGDPESIPLVVETPGSPPYEVHVAAEIDGLAPLVSDIARGRIFLISQVGLEQQAAIVARALSGAAGLHADTLFLPAGEKNKSLANLGPAYERLIDAGADRRSLLVAVGGGTVGDFVGFMAATLYRGIDFVQVPTTLLAAVDASVGGKTAVNVSRGKNLVGAFHQPRLVYFSQPFLGTLPPLEWTCGLAEMFKHALLEESGRLLSHLESNAGSMRSFEAPALRQAVADSIGLKRRVVEADEREAGLRAVLNLGHTTAHAIESFTDYGRFSHGEAVARGLVTMLLLSRRRFDLSADFLARAFALMQKLALPADTAGLLAADLSGHLRFDKKSVDGGARFVLLNREGRPEVGCPVSEAEFADVWREQQARFGQGEAS